MKRGRDILLEKVKNMRLKRQEETDNIQSILDFCQDNDIELVSYGLAPNPYGFCYEILSQDAELASMELDKMLESLTSNEEERLRAWLFDGVLK